MTLMQKAAAFARQFRVGRKQYAYTHPAGRRDCLHTISIETPWALIEVVVVRYGAGAELARHGRDTVGSSSWS